MSRQNSVSPAPPRPFYSDAISGVVSIGSSTGVALEILGNTDTNKTKQVGKMILVILIPVMALIAKTGISFSESLATQRSAAVLRDVIQHALFASEGITLLQRERGLTAVYLNAEENDFETYRKLASARLDSNEFLVRFTVYDTISLRGTTRLLQTGRDILEHLDGIRDRVDARRNITILGIIEQYTEVNLALLDDSLRVALIPSAQGIWPLVVSFGALSRAIDVMGIQRGIGGAAFSGCQLTVTERNAFIVLDAKFTTLLTTGFRYNPLMRTKFNADVAGSDGMPEVMGRGKKKILNATALREVCLTPGEGPRQAGVWFDTVTSFMELLTALQKNVTSLIRDQIPQVETAARTDMAAYLTVMISVTVLCLILSVWYSFRLQAMTVKMKDSILKMRARSEAVKEEKKKTDFLLYQMMPKRVADTLKSRKEVTPEWFDQVTIYFSDIVDWAILCAKLSPHQIVTLLNSLYGEFDEIIEKYDVYKVETIADSYMCVSGLPEKNGSKHARIIAQLALQMIRLAKTYSISSLPGVTVGLRVGIHSGPCVAGVVGTKMPRYCLFGDTVNTSSRMMTNGEALKIHISTATHRLLKKLGDFELQFRGRIPIKGKGEMDTYWLIRQGESTPDKKRVTITNGSHDQE